MPIFTPMIQELRILREISLFIFVYVELKISHSRHSHISHNFVGCLSDFCHQGARPSGHSTRHHVRGDGTERKSKRSNQRTQVGQLKLPLVVALANTLDQSPPESINETMEEVEAERPVNVTVTTPDLMQGGGGGGDDGYGEDGGVEAARIQPNANMMLESPPPTAHRFGSYGTVLEAAFVDPAYSWPPAEGEGRNAIELQASVSLLNDMGADDGTVATTESERERMTIPPKPTQSSNGKPVKWWNCCQSTDAAIMSVQEWEVARKKAIRTRKEHYATKKIRSKEYRKKNRYHCVPEGIMIYRLDTSNQTLTLMSQPNPKTDATALIQEMVIASAAPSFDKSRRGMVLKSVDGKTLNLVACEQRTAISWLETMDLMLANKGRLGQNVRTMERFRLRMPFPLPKTVIYLLL